MTEKLKDLVPKRYTSKGKIDKRLTKERPDYVQNSKGRADIIIAWDEVDRLLRAGCNAGEVAGAMGICASTLKDRIEKMFGCPFIVYAQDKRRKGDAYLRVHQYEKALGLVTVGDNTLLIWLGKTRLKQKEPTDKLEINPSIAKNFDALMEEITKFQQKD